MNNKIERLIKVWFKTANAYFVLVLVWMLLEKLIYNEVQYRVVDDIISIPIFIIIFLLFDARAKLDRSKNEDPKIDDLTDLTTQRHNDKN